MRIDGETKGPLSYKQLYTLRNPWARWLSFNAPKLLEAPPADCWSEPVLTRWEAYELRDRER